MAVQPKPAPEPQPQSQRDQGGSSQDSSGSEGGDSSSSEGEEGGGGGGGGTGGRNFQRCKEDFRCGHCGHLERGDGYTNHCTACLWSAHVDIQPGDRAAVRPAAAVRTRPSRPAG
jgi:hypothetical protein